MSDEEQLEGAALIAAERQRQVDAEGWAPEHDDEHGPYLVLTRAATCYAEAAIGLEAARLWRENDATDFIASYPLDDRLPGRIAEMASDPVGAWCGRGNDGAPKPIQGWPWESSWWKPSDDPVRNLVKAGALIAAEIDRLNRAEARR